jgi:hypothetical protein
MHLYGKLVFKRKQEDRRAGSGRLRAAAVVLLGLTTAFPSGFAQQAASLLRLSPGDKVLNDLPSQPVPVPTDPLYLRTTARNFSKPYAGLLGNPFKPMGRQKLPTPAFTNSVRLGDLVKEGKIYLSLSDAIALALENNYDIAIARYDLDIADTDILRAKAGGAGELLGAPSGAGYRHAERRLFNARDRRRPGWHFGRIRRCGIGHFRSFADRERSRSCAGKLRPDARPQACSSITRSRLPPTSLPAALRKPILTTSLTTRALRLALHCRSLFNNQYRPTTNAVRHL